MEQEIAFPPIWGGAFHTGPMIVTALVDDHRIRRILLDGGSSSEIMYEHCFEQLVEEAQAKLVPASGPLVGFTGESVYPWGRSPSQLSSAPSLCRGWSR
jgi:hypothetical protein